jgi:hypothetical protein
VAALDFPNAPVANQSYVAGNGVTYQWNGTQWIVQTWQGGAFVPLAGGSMTGPLNILSPLNTIPAGYQALNVGNGEGIQATHLYLNTPFAATSHSIYFAAAYYSSQWNYVVGSGNTFGGNFDYDGTTGHFNWLGTPAAGANGAAATMNNLMWLSEVGALTVAGGVTVGSGDLYLSRIDTTNGYITRPNTAGYKNITFWVAGGSALDNVTMNTAAFSTQGGSIYGGFIQGTSVTGYQDVGSSSTTGGLVRAQSAGSNSYAPAVLSVWRTNTGGNTAAPANSAIGQMRFEGLGSDNNYAYFGGFEVDLQGANVVGGGASAFNFNVNTGGTSGTALQLNGTNQLINPAWTIAPLSDNAIDIGISSYRFRNGYFAGQIFLSQTASAALSFNAAAGTFRFLNWATNGVQRWTIGCDNAAEGGSNTGSNFFLWGYNDAATATVTALSANRATGLVNAPSGLTTVTMATTDNSTNAATTAFVKAAIAAQTAPACLQTVLGASVTLPVAGTYYNGPAVTCSTAGKWRITAGAFVSQTGTGLDYYNYRIWNGSALVGNVETITSNGAGQNQFGMVETLVTIAASTTFTLQAADTSSTTGSLLGGSWITAQQVT